MELGIQSKQKNKLPKLILMALLSGILVSAVFFVYVNIGERREKNTKEMTLELTVPEKAKSNDTRVEVPGADVGSSSTGNVLADQEFVSEVRRFSIKPPTGWFIDNSKNTQAEVVLVRPEADILENMKFLTTISVTVRDGAGTLSDRKEEIKKGLTEKYIGYSVENDSDVMIGGRSFYAVGGYYTVFGVRIRNLNYVILYNGRDYTISFSGADASWPANEKTIISSMNSFTLL